MMGKVTPVEGTGAYTGTVKSFNAQKGFGFIQADGMEDIFVHMKGCVGGAPSSFNSFQTFCSLLYTTRHATERGRCREV
eukprot:g9136.t1